MLYYEYIGYMHGEEDILNEKMKSFQACVYIIQSIVHIVAWGGTCE